MSLPEFNMPCFMEEVSRRKLTTEEIYLLTLRQILLNQACLLVEQSSYGNPYALAADSRTLAKRIEEFAKNKE